MANSQDEYNKALQNLLAMSGKKAEIKKVWENASPTSSYPKQEIPHDIDSACDAVSIICRLSTTNPIERVSTFRRGQTGELSVTGLYGDRLTTAQRNVAYGTNKRYTVSGGVYFNDLVNRNSEDVCIPLAMYEIKRKE